ncbi:DUF4198 domain-containing protein [uncultured Chitinophaga sp.]|uniref:DUF4198 domain-containing protein n=1 Tax=uncultured Chitinophaga sp. TaxID=339340 RepID=UPI0025EDD672|nr:DUF4198 domain-containing protein [uncultured Chitinophaga sp.]
MMKRIVFSLALILSTLFASAHAVWIETSFTGTKNKSQEVRVYLGEYADGVRDNVDKWFSNMKDVQLFVTAPNGDRQPVTLKANGNHLLGSFTPSADGTYTLSIAHTVATIYSENKIEYYATATVVTGKPSVSPLSGVTALSVVPALQTAKKQQPVPVSLFSDKQPLEKGKVEVISPLGWIKTLYTDEKGAASFSPIEAGQYLLEASRNEKVTGTLNDKPFKSVSHIVTHCIAVK